MTTSTVLSRPAFTRTVALRTMDLRFGDVMIKLTQINKTYRHGHTHTAALHDVNLEIDEGEFVAIMGPSGSGKSTLLNLLGLLDAPDTGQYHLLDRDVSGISESQRAQLRKQYIGYVFQHFNLIDELSVRENIELAILYRGMSRKQRRMKVDAVLDRLDLQHRQDYRPAELSGGQQQRVAVARALVGEQKLLLADEPTGNLDSHQGLEVMQLLQQLNEQGSTVVLVTHARDHADCARRTINLFDGAIVTQRLRAVS